MGPHLGGQFHRLHGWFGRLRSLSGGHHVLLNSGNTENSQPIGSELGSTRGRGCQGRCVMPVVYMTRGSCQALKNRSFMLTYFYRLLGLDKIFARNYHI